jgi:hypothetical protein
MTVVSSMVSPANPDFERAVRDAFAKHELMVRRLMRRLMLWVWLSLMLPAAGVAGAETAVDLELVLAVDVSLSMDVEEQRLQREGYVAAFRDPQVMKAIWSGVQGRISVAYVEWAGPFTQETLLPWTLIDAPAAAEDFAAKLAAAPISRHRLTSISSALAYSARQFESNPHRGSRRAIDISGDGPNNAGPPVTGVRAEVLKSGIIINGLPIIVRPSQSSLFDISYLDRYYADCVIGGPGSFMIPIRDKSDFASAIRQKLLLEIAGSEPPARLMRAQLKTEADKVNCLIGEQLWQRYMEDRFPQ